MVYVNQETDKTTKRIRARFTTGHKQKLPSNKRRTTRERNGIRVGLVFSGTLNRQMDKKGTKRIDGVLITRPRLKKTVNQEMDKRTEKPVLLLGTNKNYQVFRNGKSGNGQ
ncbi:uncharacterized protein LOC141885773 isoform X2 [Acropora palmata]|uniref:uncharacterized protein LOC141885773 isoform X1 n=1 Tax=Acropora palmata TaxID=6131 RepID=UPI003DA0D9FC